MPIPHWRPPLRRAMWLLVLMSMLIVVAEFQLLRAVRYRVSQPGGPPPGA